MPKNVAAAGFDVAAWQEELLTLNPWARALTINAANAEFAAARQKATLARHVEGKEVWNAWANGMLALKATLEAAGIWDASRQFVWEPLEGDNEATQVWLALASAVFSTKVLTHRFENDVSFHQSIFPSDAVFENATFGGDALFGSATFSGMAVFERATFTGKSVFECATFSGDALFVSATFSGFASFIPATFRGNTSFGGATFSDNADFGRATFRDTTFRGATFRGYADFGSATFSGETCGPDFEGATFSGGAYFGSAMFSGDADFGSATFSGDADFGSATFSDHASFGKASFGSATFSADADFGDAKFKTPVTFAGSVFQQAANFAGIDSAAALSLADAKFIDVPSFISATFKGKLRLDNVETPRYRWTFGYTPDKDATARFRELRRQAAEAQDRERELEFFVQEIRTGRFHVKGLPSWVPKVWSPRFLLGLGFGALSDFGRSLWRPLLSWLALTALCAAFYLGEHDDMRKARAALAPSGPFSTLAAYAATTRDALANPPACRVGDEPFDSINAVSEAIQLSVKNALVFDIGHTASARRTFGCLYGLVQDRERVPLRVSIASTLQALASGLLVFLFLLAVRNLMRLQ